MCKDNQMSISGFYNLRIWGLLELFREAEQYIMTAEPHTPLVVATWKTFRKKRKGLWRATLRYVLH